MVHSGRKFSVIFHDFIMVATAWLLAYGVKYNFELAGAGWEYYRHTIAIVLVCQGLILWYLGLYKGVWRFASMPDLWNILRGAAVGTLLISVVLFLYNRMNDVPRTILLLYPVFLVFLLGAPRLLFRGWKDRAIHIGDIDIPKVLILGAGRAGETLARDMLREGKYRPVGFLDDNPLLLNRKIHGVLVCGPIEALDYYAGSMGAEILMIAMPSVSGAQMRRIVEICESSRLPFRTLPKLQDFVSGHSALQEIREVAIEDLLGRSPVSLDWTTISYGLAGKVILVSGGGGSIGSELCRQVLRLGPSRLIIVDSCEFNLYKIELELIKKYPNISIHAHLVDVYDKYAVDDVLSRYSPCMIFHAAAYKHVPMLEYQARQALRNNVLGTKILAEYAVLHKCETFVMVSTDKAVNPTNVMGASKRAAEIYCQGLDRISNTRFITVRFGNVLGSAGSVVPLFHEQIRSGGPVTVTHPDITRYFMTIPEASQLILQAATMGNGGEIFVLDMGEPVKVSYLAEQMIRLSGKLPYQDIDIVYTGLRPGEKLYEELFHPLESLSPTDHEKIFLAQSRLADWMQVQSVVEAMHEAVNGQDNDLCVALLRQLVPEMMRESDLNNSNIVPIKAKQG